MYNPTHYQQNQTACLDMIARNPLGILVSLTDTKIGATPYPFMLKQKEGVVYLLTHMSRKNPQWKNFDKDVLVLFLGQNGYVSPSIYHSKNQVPTWNYDYVKVCGRPTLIESAHDISALLHESVDYFERLNGTKWRYDLPEGIRAPLEAAIVGVEIKIHHIEGKLKMGQNKSPEDRQAVQEYFKKRR